MSSVIREGLRHGHCVLCGTALNTYLDELPCPHWFLAPGWRGFRNRTLARVFELFGLAQLFDYLRIAAEGAAWRRRERDGSVEIGITWGRRDWEFSYEQRDAGPDGTVRRFVLAIRYDGALVDKARIAVAGDGQVEVTPLVQRRRPVAPA